MGVPGAASLRAVTVDSGDLLAATRRVLARYAEDPDGRWRYTAAPVEAAVHTIVRHGSGADAAALLAAFLADPANRAHVLPALAAHGDAETAERLIAGCVHDGWLRDGVPAEVLQVIGWLGHEPATALLWRHGGLDGDHAVQSAALKGLTHVPCLELADEIDAALYRHRFRALFPEFLPVLAPKTGDPGWARRLYDWGSTSNGFGFPGASTDCNAGLLLGLALLGADGLAEARELFGAALWSPRWEAWSGSTGTLRAAYAGVRILGDDLPTLFSAMNDAIGAAKDHPGTQRVRARVHAVLLMTGLVTQWLGGQWTGLRADGHGAESALEVYEVLFNGEESLTTVIRGIVADGYEQGVQNFAPYSALWQLSNVGYDVEARLALEVRHESELAHARGGS